MEMQYVAMIVVAVIAAIGGGYGNHISNKPKSEESKHNRIELIITHLEKNWEKCEKRYTKSCEVNRDLRIENRELKRKLEDSQKGGE